MKKAIKNIEAMGFPWQTRDPFLFAAHHRDHYPPGNENLEVPGRYLQGRPLGQDFTIKDGFRMYHGQSVPGFPVHPHRGFETITINKQGFVDHSDSLGAAGRFGEGDVQWMTAGKGVQHSEMFPLLSQEESNTLEIFQIWLNLPARSKMVEPYFKMLWKDMVPHIVEKDEMGKQTTIDLVAGKLGDQSAPDPTPDSWAADPDNEVMVLSIEMEAGARCVLPAGITGNISRSLYFYRGASLKVAGETLQNYHMADVDPAQDLVLVNGPEPSGILLLQGKPIAEPVAMQGPFVMNTQEEILETYAEYRRTQFGGWPWDSAAPHHGKETGRFALHADGRKEIP